MRLFFLGVSLLTALSGTSAILCYWCSGVDKDRACELNPYSVIFGPGVINCTSKFCLASKVMDGATGQVLSFARLCDGVAKTSQCVRDTKLLTCYISCRIDLCNDLNPDIKNLPLISYDPKLDRPLDIDRFTEPRTTETPVPRRTTKKKVTEPKTTKASIPERTSTNWKKHISKLTTEKIGIDKSTFLPGNTSFSDSSTDVENILSSIEEHLHDGRYDGSLKPLLGDIELFVAPAHSINEFPSTSETHFTTEEFVSSTKYFNPTTEVRTMSTMKNAEETTYLHPTNVTINMTDANYKSEDGDENFLDIAKSILNSATKDQNNATNLISSITANITVPNENVTEGLNVTTTTKDGVNAPLSGDTALFEDEATTPDPTKSSANGNSRLANVLFTIRIILFSNIVVLCSL